MELIDVNPSVKVTRIVIGVSDPKDISKRSMKKYQVKLTRKI